MEAEKVRRLVDGSQISDSLGGIDDRAARLFDDLEAGDDGCVTAAQCQASAVEEITNLLAGIQLPKERFDPALKASQFPIDDSFRMDRATFATEMRNLLRSTADALNDQPLVVSDLDGTIIKSLLEDEDDFAMLAENLFTELDVDDRGKITPDKLRAALLRMGLEMGVPVPSAMPAAEDLLSSSLAKYSSCGDHEIGQSRFAELLQGILEDIAGSLASHPMTVTLNVKPSIMEMEGELLYKTIDGMFEEFVIATNGKLDRDELRVFLESRGMEWGLPDEDLTGSVYEDMVTDTADIGELDKEGFRKVMKYIIEDLENMVVDLGANSP